MRRHLVALLACPLLVPGHAHGGPPTDGPDGSACAFQAADDTAPDAPEGAQLGTVTGGPIFGDGTLVCTVQYDGGLHSNTTGVVAQERAPSSDGVAVMEPRRFAFVAADDSPGYVCTRWETRNATLYWHPGGAGNLSLDTGHWTLDPSTPCQGVRTFDPDADCDVVPAMLPVGAHLYRGLRRCRAAPPTGHITIHRFPASVMPPVGGVRLWAAPVAANGTPWVCTDVHTNALVGTGSLLTSPDPGVSCTPPSPYSNECYRVDAGGYHADSGLGAVWVESSCTGLTVATPIQIPSSWPGYSTSGNGFGYTPWTCRTNESLAVPKDVDYWVFCDVNL